MRKRNTLGPDMILSAPRHFKEWTGTFEGALILSQLLEAEGWGTEELTAEDGTSLGLGWFGLPMVYIQDVNQIGRGPAEYAVRQLINLGLIERRLFKMPARAMWRIAPNFDELEQIFLISQQWTEVVRKIYDRVSRATSGNVTVCRFSANSSESDVDFKRESRLKSTYWATDFHGESRSVFSEVKTPSVNLVNRFIGLSHDATLTPTVSEGLDTARTLNSEQSAGVDVPDDYRPRTPQELDFILHAVPEPGREGFYPSGYLLAGKAREILRAVGAGREIAKQQGERAAYMACLEGLKISKRDTTGRRLLCVSLPPFPPSWVEEKFRQSNQHKWNLSYLISAFINPKLLSDHCQTALAIPLSEEKRDASSDAHSGPSAADFLAAARNQRIALGGASPAP